MGLFSKLFHNNVTGSRGNSLAAVNNKATQYNPLMNIHQDVRDLIWIGDGKYKNFVPKETLLSKSTVNGITISITCRMPEEPSLIYTSLPVSFEGKNVEKLPYYPTYKDITPEQKGLYWKLLQNPYDGSVEIGYVFILYYGLERYLLSSKFERAIDVIIKLRDVHSNKSFQHYTANAVILTCLYNQRPDLVLKFISSLDKEYEFAFSPDLYLLCVHELDLKLSSRDIMRMAKSVGFTKTTYIKDYPQLFENALNGVIEGCFGSKQVSCNSLISNSDFCALPSVDVPVFANISINDKSIAIPSITSSQAFKDKLLDVLNVAHEVVKSELSNMRKNGDPLPNRNSVPADNKKKVIEVFDSEAEAELMRVYKNARDNSLDQHFASIALQDFYYKYRELDSVYLDKCILYCEDDISRLPKIQAIYQEEERKKISMLGRYGDSGPFNGRITAFKRLAIIYEKQKNYQKAIDICDKAVQYYYLVGMPSEGDTFEERKSKILLKKEKK